MRNWIFTATLALLPVAPVLAEDEFTGPHIGLSGGWARYDASVVDQNGTDLGRIKGDTADIVAQIGYDAQLNDNFVVGVEAEAGRGIGKVTHQINATRSLEIKPRWVWSLSARAGVLATEKTLVYVRGGYVGQRDRITYFDPAIVGGSSRNSDTGHGWFAGGGIEQKISDTAAIRAEYRYSEDERKHRVLGGLVLKF